MVARPVRNASNHHKQVQAILPQQSSEPPIATSLAASIPKQHSSKTAAAMLSAHDDKPRANVVVGLGEPGPRLSEPGAIKPNATLASPVTRATSPQQPSTTSTAETLVPPHDQQPSSTEPPSQQHGNAKPFVTERASAFSSGLLKPPCVRSSSLQARLNPTPPAPPRARVQQLSTSAVASFKSRDTSSGSAVQPRPTLQSESTARPDSEKPSRSDPVSLPMVPEYQPVPYTRFLHAKQCNRTQDARYGKCSDSDLVHLKPEKWTVASTRKKKKTTFRSASTAVCWRRSLRSSRSSSTRNLDRSKPRSQSTGHHSEEPGPRRFEATANSLHQWNQLNLRHQSTCLGAGVSKFAQQVSASTQTATIQTFCKRTQTETSQIILPPSTLQYSEFQQSSNAISPQLRPRTNVSALKHRLQKEPTCFNTAASPFRLHSLCWTPAGKLLQSKTTSTGSKNAGESKQTRIKTAWRCLPMIDLQRHLRQLLLK